MPRYTYLKFLQKGMTRWAARSQYVIRRRRSIRAFPEPIVHFTGGKSINIGGLNVEVLVISASSISDLKRFPMVPFTLVADPNLEMFKHHGVSEAHATIVRGVKGNEVFRHMGESPFMDVAAVTRALKEAIATTSSQLSRKSSR